MLHRPFASLLAVVLFSSTTTAQVSLFDWELAGNPSGSGTQTATTLNVTGPDEFNCTPTSTYFATIAPVGGSVSVQVDFMNLDSSAAQGHPDYDAPTAIVDGDLILAPPVDPTSSFGWPTGSYTLEFDVAAGDVFGLGVWALDCFSGPGVAIFHDLVFTPVRWSTQPHGLDPRLRFDIAGSNSLDGPRALDAAGDVNADGVPDFVVGSFGKATVYSGADGAIVRTFTGSSNFGDAVAGAGDVDGDGYDDIIVGASDQMSFKGTAQVFSGQTGALLFSLQGSQIFDFMGEQVAGIGDADADGFDDVAVLQLQVGGNPAKVIVASGATGAVLFSIDAPLQGKKFGDHMAGAGDVDGDGHDDLIVGSKDRVYVYSGQDGSLVATNGGALGTDVSVSTAGDIDGDGLADVVIGAPNFPSGPIPFAGRVKVYSPATGTVISVFNGLIQNGGFGQSVSGGSDLDGDGDLDVAVAAPGTDPGGVVYLIDALSGAVFGKVELEAAGEASGELLAGLGDVDGDGLGDLVVGTESGGAAGYGETRVYRHLGHPGIPQLTGLGSLEPGSPVSLRLTDALPNQLVYVIGGTSYIQLPFMGGVLGPSVEIVIPAVTNAGGTLLLSTTWPAGLPTWWTLWMQAWTDDDLAPRGFGASRVVAASQL